MSVQFTVDAPLFEGQVFDLLPQDDLTWLEASELERALGCNLVELDDIEDGIHRRRSARTLSAFMWISIHRVRPEITYEQVAGTPQRAVAWLVGESPDPTEGSETAPTIETPDAPI